jgi:hypothetical protein
MSSCPKIEDPVNLRLQFVIVKGPIDHEFPIIAIVFEKPDIAPELVAFERINARAAKMN